LAAAFALYLIATIVVYILAITTHDGPKSTSTNGYVGLLMWDIIFASPVFVLMFWFITVPLIIVVGVLVACVHRTPGARAGDVRPPPEERHETG
jgi:hypothetical protein